MEAISLRLASGDHGAVHHLASVLSALFCQTTFSAARLGREGDWLCYGTIRDPNLDTPAEKYLGAAQWLTAYAALRPILRRSGVSVVTLDQLDQTVTTAMIEIDERSGPQRQRRA